MSENEHGPHYEEMDATPVAREVFLGYTRGGYDFFDAVAEYIDNSIEQAGNQPDSRQAKIIIKAGHNGSAFYVSIQDNAGGCSRSDAARFIRPGSTGLNPKENRISRFGIGGKAAGLSVARRVIVVSRARGEAGFKVILDKDEILKKEDWKFRVYTIGSEESVQEGTTIVTLDDIDSKFHANFPTEYVKNFTERYSLLLDKHGPTIIVGEHQLSPLDPLGEMLNSEEAPINCGPLTKVHQKSYDLNVEGTSSKERVEIKITVGLLPERSTIGKAGAKIFCNKRLVGKYHEIGLLEGTGIADRRVHPGQDQSWLRAIVTISGPAELMPWTNRKDSLDRASPVYFDLEKFLAQDYHEFLEDHVYKEKEKMRSRTGSKEFPDIINLITEGYRTKLKTGAMDPKSVRRVIAETVAFYRAMSKVGTPPERPSPPRKKGEILLNANVEVAKVQEVKKILSELYGYEDVKNTDVVRVAIEHFTKCQRIFNDDNNSINNDQNQVDE
jgi:hypothetical protein